jgi:hypothetical protein
MSGREQSTRRSLDGSGNLPEMRQQDGIWTRPSLSRRSTNPNVFSDDYSVEPLDTPDGNRPRRSLSIASNNSSSTLRQIQPTHSPTQENGATVNPFADEARSSLDGTPLRSSIWKGRAGDLNRQSSVTTTSTVSNRSGPHRSLTRAMSPYTGATGPSHPYGMYPQIGVSRSASIATMSTVRPEDGPLQGTSAPQHPYGMYQQNIALEDGVDDPPIPVGFPGASLQSYQQRAARPDDVGDIIGPDGHLEQLPPYTRYPDGVPLRVGMGPASIASATREQVQPVQTEPAAVSDVSSSTLINIESNEPIARSEVNSEGTSTTQVEEKSRRARRMCCGAPIWLMILLGLGMLVGGLIGSVIGGVLGERRAEERSARRGRESATPSFVTVTYTSDVTPLPAIPTGIPNLPTGQFVVPASIQNQSKFCVSMTSYTSSWSCQDQGFLNIEIFGSSKSASVSIPPPVINGTFTYGAQAPFLPMPTQSLHYMLDKADPEFGPALFFASPFDKLVIVPEDAFPAPSPQKRSVNELDLMGNQFRREQVAQQGDRPWFCWWNMTAMEFFVYVNETSADAKTPPMMTHRPTATITGAGPGTPTTGTSPTFPHAKRQTGLPPVSFANYPRRVKIEEKRLIPDAPRPYCVQMQVLDNWQVVPFNNQITLINAMQPGMSSTSQKREDDDDEHGLFARDDDGYDNTCYCDWLSG